MKRVIENALDKLGAQKRDRHEKQYFNKVLRTPNPPLKHSNRS